MNIIMKKNLLFLIFILYYYIHLIVSEDLYELLGVRSDVSSTDLKKLYRKLALKYHPDKQDTDKKEEMKIKFLKIANAYKVLSDPKRREKYDLYGIADEQGFKNFDEAFKDYHDSVEDTLINWVALLLICGMGILPFFFLQGTTCK